MKSKTGLLHEAKWIYVTAVTLDNEQGSGGVEEAAWAEWEAQEIQKTMKTMHQFPRFGPLDHWFYLNKFYSSPRHVNFK